MPQPGPTRHATDLPSRGRLAIVRGIALVAALHSTLVLVWVMPTNPIRDAIGPRVVERYIDNEIVPFEQSWSVFAPTPRRAGENVVVRARLGATGSTTEWFDITADEDERISHLPNPSRFHSVTRRLGGIANERIPELTDAQLNVMRSPAPSTREMSRLPGDYVVVDDLLTRFGSMYAIARWGDGVSSVQIRVGHRLVPPFAQRNRVAFEDVPFTYQRLGWRTVVRGDAAAQAAFDGYVERASRTGSE